MGQNRGCRAGGTDLAPWPPRAAADPSVREGVRPGMLRVWPVSQFPSS